MSFHYEIELRNKADELVDIFQKDIASLNWSYSTLGGCDELNVALRREFDAYGDIALDYDLQLWRVEDPFGSPGSVRLPAQFDPSGQIALGTSFTSAKELRWSGFIRRLAPVLEEVEVVPLACSGYMRQLSYIMIPPATAAYASQDVTTAAKAIIDNIVIPGSRIKRTGALSLCVDTGVTLSATGINFSGRSALEAIKTLAEIGGNAEWGVRADREFYFTPRATTVKQMWEIGDRVKFYQPETTTDELVHRVYLQGASGVFYTLNNAANPNPANYSKERVVLASNVATAADATAWGTAYFSKFGSVQPRGVLRLAATDAWIEQMPGETMPPLGRLRVHGGPVFVVSGETFTGDLPWTLAGVIGGYTDTQFRIEQIRYQPSDNGLNIEIALGERRGGLTDLMRAIDYKLSELRGAL